MNFTEREFSTVTDKLERYASQIGTLQAHLDTEKKLNGMMATLGDKDLEETAEGKLADQIIIDNSGVIEHR